MTSINESGPKGAGHNRQNQFDFGLLVSLFRRRFPVLLVVMALCLCVAWGYTHLKTPQYTSSVSILIDARQKDVLTSDQAVLSDLPVETMAIDTEVQILSSYDLAQEVVERLNLGKHPVFVKAERDPVAFLLSRMDVRRRGLTYVIVLSITMPDAKLSAEIANAYAHQYIRNQIETKSDANIAAIGDLNSRLAELRDQALADETAVQEYKIAHNLMSANGATMAEQEVSTLNTQIAAARADYAEKEARFAATRSQIHGGSNGADTTEALNSDVIKDLRRQRAEVSRRQADLESRYGPLHPEVEKGKKQLADFDLQIQGEIERVLSGLRAEVEVSRQRYQSLVGSRSFAAGSLRSNNVAEVRLVELERASEASRVVYEAFLNRSKEVTAQSGMQQSDARVFSLAKPSREPSEPNLYMNLALGAISGLLFGVTIVGILELSDNTFKTSSQIERQLGLKNAASIPMIKGATRNKSVFVRDYIVGNLFSAYAESLRHLRTFIALTNRETPAKTIMFASALPGEGKTITALSFARAAAIGGSKVLLIDSDLRQHALTSVLGLNPDSGIEQALFNPTLSQFNIVKDEESGADLLLVSGRAEDATEVLTEDRIRNLIDKLYSEYDYIVFDTPPVLALNEARIIAALVDFTVLLVQWSRTPRNAVESAVAAIEDTGTELSCVCLTQVDLDVQAQQGYGDSLYYYSSYQKYYYAK